MEGPDGQPPRVARCRGERHAGHQDVNPNACYRRAGEGRSRIWQTNRAAADAWSFGTKTGTCSTPTEDFGYAGVQLFLILKAGVGG